MKPLLYKLYILPQQTTYKHYTWLLMEIIHNTVLYFVFITYSLLLLFSFLEDIIMVSRIKSGNKLQIFHFWIIWST